MALATESINSSLDSDLVFDTGNPWVKMLSSLPVSANIHIHRPRVWILTGFVTDTDMGMQPVDTDFYFQILSHILII